MSFKNISISTEVYDQLKKVRNEGESFSEAISKLIKKEQRVSDLAGIFTDEEADALEKGVAKVRKEAKVRKWSY
ncbi:antitoxin VapB family protein [Candidatus Micrarchaeota archaeon]|nr:antitoxin VapB family protein [Candidatus Micrarchaeota archaeon]